MKYIVLFAIVLANSAAHAADALFCQETGGENLHRQIRVYQTSNGHFEVEAANCVGLPAFTDCQPYNKTTVVEETYMHFAGEEIPTGHFSGNGINIVHLCGGYDYSDSATGLQLYFPDTDCTATTI